MMMQCALRKSDDVTAEESSLQLVISSLTHSTIMPPPHHIAQRIYRCAVSPSSDADVTDEKEQSAVLFKPSSVPSPSAAAASTDVSYTSSPFSFIDYARSHPTTDEFVYCRSVAGSPYDMRIVPFAQIKGETHYYTMSRVGVTEFNGAQSTTFTSLSQWEREHKLYVRIRSMTFFKTFRLSRVFRRWTKFIRTDKMNRCRAVLKANLYILSPTLRPSLILLKARCFDASKWPIFAVGADVNGGLKGEKSANKKLQTLTHFEHNQTAMQSTIGALISSMADDCKEIVLSACQCELDAFLTENGFRKNSAAKSFDSAGFRVSHAERAAHRSKCRSLTKFIRLVDYLIRDTMTTLAIDRTNELKSMMNRQTSNNANAQTEQTLKRSSHRSQSVSYRHHNHAGHSDDSHSPLFSVELLQNQRELAFSPDLLTFQNTVQRRH